jgi:hypothetical protein
VAKAKREKRRLTPTNREKLASVKVKKKKKA